MTQKIFFYTFFIAVFLFCILGFFSCIHHSTTVIIKEDDITVSDTLVVAEKLDTVILGRIELPAITKTNLFVEHHYYAMEYDTAQRHTVWVAYKFCNDYNKKTVSRSDAWAFDPIILEKHQSLDKKNFKTYPGYDRGHLIASEDRVFNLDANKETFYFTNMSPQMGCFNQQMWKYLEEQVRTWANAADCDTLYVVTGGAIKDGVETLGVLASNNNVTIPKYYFKALVKRQGDTFNGIAFWFENRCHRKLDAKGKDVTEKPTHKYSMSIDSLEKLTGINFFPNLKFDIAGNAEWQKALTMRDTTQWVFPKTNY